MAGHDLLRLQARFPGYEIWREETPAHVRYVARSRSLRLSPYTVITPDLAELADRLLSAQSCKSPGIASRPHGQPNIARMYSFLLGGKDHLAADRTAASQVLAQFPEIAGVARANREFVARAVCHLARHGITQFIDLGSGLPTSPNVHEIARSLVPGARVAYVDHDPVVLAHARALLAPDDTVGVVAGDIRDPACLLTDASLTRVIDNTRPAGVLLTSVLHFLAPEESDATVAVLREWMAPGSYLVISTGTATGTDPRLIDALQQAYRDTARLTCRAAGDIRAWFDGLTMVPPGLADVWAWPTVSLRRPAASRARFLAGVGRKDAARPAWPL